MNALGLKQKKKDKTLDDIFSKKKKHNKYINNKWYVN